MKVAAVVLAAGSSSRLGQAKQLVVLGKERLLERAVRVAGEAGCAPIVVVLGARGPEIEQACTLGSALVLHNEAWSEGMASSIRLGVGAVHGLADAVMVLGCDQPAVTAGHLLRLMGQEVTASLYAGRRGIPACFPQEVLGRLMELRGDRGARDLLQRARAIELPRGELDIDTPESLALLRSIYGA